MNKLETVTEEWVSKEKLRLTEEMSNLSSQIQKLEELKAQKLFLIATLSICSITSVRYMESVSISERGHSIFNTFMPIQKYIK